MLNVGIFGTINGFITTALFVLGPESVKPEFKEAAGFVMVLGLLTGIFFGCMVALSF